MTYKSFIITMNLDQLVAEHCPGLLALGNMLDLSMAEILTHCVNLADSVCTWTFSSTDEHGEYVLDDCTSEFARLLVQRNELEVEYESLLVSIMKQTARGIVRQLPIRAVQLEFLQTDTRGPTRLFYMRAKIEESLIYGHLTTNASNTRPQTIL